MKAKLRELWKNRRAHVWAVVAIVAFLVCVVVLFGSRKRYKSVSASAAVHMMESGEALVCDVRTAEEYGDGHIPGAVNIPVQDLRDGNFDALPEDRDRTLLIYCYAGRRSKEAAEILLRAGYKNAYEFGGIVDWAGDIERDGKIVEREEYSP